MQGRHAVVVCAEMDELMLVAVGLYCSLAFTTSMLLPSVLGSSVSYRGTAPISFDHYSIGISLPLSLVAAPDRHGRWDVGCRIV